MGCPCINQTASQAGPYPWQELQFGSGCAIWIDCLAIAQRIGLLGLLRRLRLHRPVVRGHGLGGRGRLTPGQGDLIGASLGELPVAAGVAAVTGGGVQPQAAADEAAAKLTAIQDTLR